MLHFMMSPNFIITIEDTKYIRPTISCIGISYSQGQTPNTHSWAPKQTNFYHDHRWEQRVDETKLLP